MGEGRQGGATHTSEARVVQGGVKRSPDIIGISSLLGERLEASHLSAD